MILYIANRSEIARRIIRSAKKIGATAVVGYAREDRELPFVREASRSLEIQTSEPRDAYLDAERVIDAAKKLGATHLHPGYGFLSERADFAEAVEKAGIRFVGPRPETIRSLGDKMASRDFVRTLEIPLLPSYEEKTQDDALFEFEASKIEFPLLVKPSAGGGGKGMAIVRQPSEIRDAVASARRVAMASFKDDRLFAERYLETARHIEVQIFGDGKGNILTLGERECSLQRRYQKLVEETPCESLPEKLRLRILDWSRKIGEKSKYRSAGTIEWIWDGKDQIYFLEVNSRLQVEHPVTEMVWGVDLVELQLREACDQLKEFPKLKSAGHALEVRLCAEDPSQDFLPSAGKIQRLRLPENVRVDFGFAEGNVVSSSFDSMLGKLIAFAPTRQECLDKLVEALEKTILLGPSTNRAYLRQILLHTSVREGNLRTSFLSEFPYRLDLIETARAVNSLQTVSSTYSDDEVEDLDFDSPWGGVGRSDSNAFVEEFSDRRYYFFPFADWSERIDKKRQHSRSSGGEQEAQNEIRTPMPGKIVQLHIKKGDSVTKGQVLLVLEAMKMEHQVRAGFDGRVKDLRVSAGQQVLPDDLLLELERVKELEPAK